GKHKVYGAVNISVDKLDESGARVDADGKKGSKIGMKGSMNTSISDFKAIYQIEAGMLLGPDQTGGLITQRDTWAGLSSKSMGTVRVGTMATHYKQTGAMTDVLFGTSAAGRGLIGTQSGLHGGTGAGSGRATQMIRYDSPSISGAKVIAQYQLTSLENNLGLGLQYKAGNYLAYFDYIDLKTAGGATPAKADKTAMKFGGKAKFGPASLAVQYELDDKGSALNSATPDATGNQLHVQGTYTLGATTLILTVGRNDENIGWVVAASQKVAKKASVYAGYASSGSSVGAGDAGDSSAITVGMAVAFAK
ncbi:MAG TPA: porin, partial [Gammaproteobacteria bacterium]|nr:porin [Gammaproteobacteria bacterium]